MGQQTGNHLRRIDSVLMAVSVDPEDQTEGVVAVMTPAGVSMPLLAADPDREPFVREQAKIVAAASGMSIKLVRLTGRIEVASISPDGTETSLS